MELGRCFFEPQNNTHGYAFQPSNGDTVILCCLLSPSRSFSSYWLKSQSDEFSGLPTYRISLILSFPTFLSGFLRAHSAPISLASRFSLSYTRYPLEVFTVTFPALEHFSVRCACISPASFRPHHLSEAILITLFKTEIQPPAPFLVPLPLLFLYRPYHHLTYCIYTLF